MCLLARHKSLTSWVQHAARLRVAEGPPLRVCRPLCQVAGHRRRCRRLLLLLRLLLFSPLLVLLLLLLLLLLPLLLLLLFVDHRERLGRPCVASGINGSQARSGESRGCCLAATAERSTRRSRLLSACTHVTRERTHRHE